jgi:hypothetical protein
VASPVAPHLRAELAVLRAAAAERGAEAGLHDLPDTLFENAIRAQAVFLGRTLHSAPAPGPARLALLQAELEKESQELSGTIETLRSQREAAAQLAAEPPHAPWRPTVNVFLSAGIACLSLEAAGFPLGWRLWAAAALACAMLASNLPVVPLIWSDMTSLARHVRQRRRLQKRLRAVHRRIDSVRERRISAADCETVEARWVSDVCALLRAEYDVQRARGRAARRLGRVVAA